MTADGTAEYVLEILKPRGEASSGEALTADPLDGGSAASLSNETRLGGLIGRSPAMRQLFEMIRLVADSQATVLLQGESGTGKELVARTIHNLSHRKDQPFGIVDCGSLPETLLESELFGHVKGAFTGALYAKKGLLEAADGGTIFLDEIADTSAHFQSKLLRFLQEGEIKPVGSNRSVKVNVRVISATNKDLMELIKAKAFREDLYYRLAVLPLLLSPLRDRREDIPLLVQHFVERSCKRHRKPIRVVEPDAMQALAEAPWPGNIRELEHMVERVVVTAPGPQLTRQDFFGSSQVVSPIAADADLRAVARRAAQTAERACIEEALRQAAGKKARAARTLKISRAGLYNKLRAYKIE
ncbi:MAG: sigma-54-dependent Fis family transcriptional regulator [Nitrospirae bacterium]|nr:sigma-54-dependent Fis family transcriptional regulator [Nitrospirota bacterium]